LIEKAERPDFRCTFGSRALGIEVTEATDPRDQQEMTEFERTGATATLGTFGGRFKHGAANPENAWLADVLKQLGAKSPVMDAYPSPMPEYRLLLYTNSNAGRLTYHWPRVFEGLGPTNERIWKYLIPSLKHVSVICDEWPLML
jgi:hypothetical protein